MASTYLSKTFSGSPTNAKIFTISCWVKKSSNGSDNAIYGKDGTTNSASQIYFNTSDQLRFFDNTSGTDMDLLTNRLFRDNSGWYHIVYSVDSTQATSSNRVKLYVNGVQETSFATSNYPDQNASFVSTDNGKDTFVGVSENTGGSKFGYLNGSMTHYHFIDGTAYSASTFGETDATTGIWKPKTAPSVTYGTNGFFLKFENSGSMGTDSSGNANNFTVNGTLTQTVDTPSNVFATWNALDTTDGTNSTIPVLANGNTKATGNTSQSVHNSHRATLGATQGKWYWEIKIASAIYGTYYPSLGIFSTEGRNTAQIGTTADAYMYMANGQKYNNSSLASYGNSYTQNDIIGVALDLDNNYIYFAKNGTWQNSGDPTSGSSGTGAAFNITTDGYSPVFNCRVDSGNATSIEANFGNGYFGTTAVASAGTSTSGDDSIWEYDCPSGYYGLNTKNINAQEYS